MHRHPHRLQHGSIPASGYCFLTMCTKDRRPVFVDADIAESVVTQVLAAAQARNVAVIAYCVMPDHLHAVLEIGTGGELAAFVHLAKQRTGYHFKQRRGQLLWQRSYFDRTLRRNESLSSVVRYVIENPVRAGLCVEVDAYPHWGSERYSRSELLEFVGRTRTKFVPPV